MTRTPRIERFREAHRPSLLALYGRYFGPWSRARFEQRWRWQFESNPFGAHQPAAILVASDGDQVLGLAASYPLPLRIAGKTRVIHCNGDLVVEQRHRLLAIALTREVFALGGQLCAGMSAEAGRLTEASGGRVLPISTKALVFPRRTIGPTQRALRRNLPRALRALSARLPARLVGSMRRPREALAPRRLPRPSKIALEQVTRFDAEYDELWREFCLAHDASLAKTGRYMNWRYVDGPARTLERRILRDARGRWRGLVITGLRAVVDHERMPCGTNGEIFELIVRDPDDLDAVRMLALDALFALDRASVDEIAATGLSERYHNTLLELGFVKVSSHQRLALTFSDAADRAWIVDPARTWYVSAGDGDQLYTVGL